MDLLPTPDFAQTPRAVLWAFLRQHRDGIWIVAVYAVFVGVLVLATPLAVQALVNGVAFGTTLQPVFVLAVLLLAFLIFGALLRGAKTWVAEVLQRRMFKDTVGQLAERLPRLDPQSRALGAMGYPAHRFFELFKIQKAASTLLLGGIDGLLAILVGLLVLAFYHPALLVFALLLGVALLLIVRLGRGGVNSAIAESAAKYAAADFIADVVSARSAFRTPSGERYAFSRLDALAATYLSARGAHFRVVMRQFSAALPTQAISSAALLGLGGYLVVAQELTLGQLVAAELIVTAVVAVLGEASKYLENFYDSRPPRTSSTACSPCRPRATCPAARSSTCRTDRPSCASASCVSRCPAGSSSTPPN
jgi:putative ABC transport system ATP-binding protein